MDNNLKSNFFIFPYIKSSENETLINKFLFFSCYGKCIIECDNEAIFNDLRLLDITEKYIIYLKKELSFSNLEYIKENKNPIIIDFQSELIKKFNYINRIIIHISSFNDKDIITEFVKQGYLNFLITVTQENKDIIQQLDYKNLSLIFLFESIQQNDIISLSKNFIKVNLSSSFNEFSIGLLNYYILQANSKTNIFLIVIFNQQGILLEALQISDKEEFIKITNSKSIRITGKIFKILRMTISPDNNSLLLFIECDNIYDTYSLGFQDNDSFVGGLKQVQNILSIRQKSKDKNSYTVKLLKDPIKIKTKLIEEANELVCSGTNKEMIHETADLLYFITLNLQYHNLSIIDVEEFYFDNLIKNYSISEKCFDKGKFKIGYVNNDEGLIDFLPTLLDLQIKKFSSSFNIKNNDRIKYIGVSIDDITNFFNKGIINSIVCYEYDFDNIPYNLHSVSLGKENISSLVIISKNFSCIEEIRTTNIKRKIIIMTKHLKIANDWIRNKDIIAKVVNITDNLYLYLHEEMCDIIIAPHNKELESFNFKVIDIYSNYELNLFIDTDKFDIFNTIHINN